MSKRPLRIDDMWRFADPPVFLLVRESCRYGSSPIDTIDGYALHVAPFSDRQRIRLPALAQMTLTRGQDGYPTTIAIDLDRQPFAREERLTRHDRRRRARLGSTGRRDARPVAIVTQWRIDVFMEQGTPSMTIARVANAHARIIARTWRHGSAKDWSRRALALRQKSERKAT